MLFLFGVVKIQNAVFSLGLESAIGQFDGIARAWWFEIQQNTEVPE
jgi:hypothetical protein